MDNKKVSHKFIVPYNFLDSGKIMGLFYIRNIVEAVSLSFILYIIEHQIFSTYLHLLTKTYSLIMLFTILPLFILCFIGVKGEPFTVYIMIKFKYILSAKRYTFNLPNPTDMTETPPVDEKPVKKHNAKREITKNKLTEIWSKIKTSM